MDEKERLRFAEYKALVKQLDDIAYTDNIIRPERELAKALKFLIEEVYLDR